jgi:hypothetical protein
MSHFCAISGREKKAIHFAKKLRNLIVRNSGKDDASLQISCELRMVPVFIYLFKN